jgi:hypothetical protein
MLYWRWFNRPHHPLSRLLFGAIGAVLLVGVLVFGLFALIAFALIGSIVALTRAFTRAAAPRARTATPHVLEGEFTVLPNRTASIKH